jgi:hypothetical protein
MVLFGKKFIFLGGKVKTAFTLTLPPTDIYGFKGQKRFSNP